MNVLVCGGAGYIGSHVVLNLMECGHKVCVFDNLSSGLEKNLFKENDFVKGSILSLSDLDLVFSKHKFDAVVHLAAFKAAGESMIHMEKYSVNNICGTINLLNAMSKYGVKKFIFSSSAAVYGSPKYLPIDENHPQDPENYYGFTKLEIERILTWYEKLKGIKFVAFRYFNAAGYDTLSRITGLEQNPMNLIPVIMEVCFKIREKLFIFGDDYDTPDGTCIRDYVHVSDLADAHGRAISYLQNEGSLILNLGTSRGISVLEVVNKVKEISKIDFKIEFTPRRLGDPARLYASSDAAERVLDFKPRFSDIDNIISSTLKAYKTNYS